MAEHAHEPDAIAAVCMLVMCGLPASGKSTLASALKAHVEQVTAGSGVAGRRLAEWVMALRNNTVTCKIPTCSAPLR